MGVRRRDVVGDLSKLVREGAVRGAVVGEADLL